MTLLAFLTFTFYEGAQITSVLTFTVAYDASLLETRYLKRTVYKPACIRSSVASRGRARELWLSVAGEKCRITCPLFESSVFLNTPLGHPLLYCLLGTCIQYNVAIMQVMYIA